MEDYEHTSATTPFLARWVANHPDLKMGGEATLTLKEFRGLIRYLCHRDNQTFPFYNAAAFKQSITSHAPWATYRQSGDRITVICSEKILKESQAYMARLKAQMRRDRMGGIVAAYQGPALGPPVCAKTEHDYRPSIPPLATIAGNEDCLILMTAPGLGKTQCIVKHVKQLPLETPVVVVSFRITLSEKQRADFAGADFIHYQDACVSNRVFKLEDHHRIIIQADSLSRLGWTNTNKNTVVILDEWESLTSHLYESPFVRNLPSIVEKLTDLIRCKSKLT